MHIVNIHEAKMYLLKLIEAASHGEETIITKAGKPIARLCPFEIEKPQRKFGVLKGKISIAENFDAPLPKKILQGFKD